MTAAQFKNLYKFHSPSRLVKGGDDFGIKFRCGHLYLEQGRLYICFSDDWKVSKRKPGQFFPDGQMKKKALSILRGIIASELKVSGETEFIAEVVVAPSEKVLKVLLEALQMRDIKGSKKAIFSAANRREGGR